LPKTIRRVEKLKEVVPKGMTLAEMALGFILSHAAVSTTIAGMRKAEHVRQNIASSDAGGLDKALLAELKKHRWDRTPTRWSDCLASPPGPAVLRLFPSEPTRAGSTLHPLVTLIF